MKFDEETPPSVWQDWQRLGFWLGASLLLHAVWLYFMQASLPIQSVSPAPRGELILLPADPASSLPVGFSRFYQPPTLSDEELKEWFDAVSSPSTEH